MLSCAAIHGVLCCDFCALMHHHVFLMCPVMQIMTSCVGTSFTMGILALFLRAYALVGFALIWACVLASTCASKSVV